MNDSADYAEKNKMLEDAKGVMETLAGSIQVEAMKLSDWRNVDITNHVHATSRGHSEPAASATINGQQWPTIGAVGQALNAYHKALHEANAAYRSLPEDMRKVTKEPIP